jgi:hypothetical protein
LKKLAAACSKPGRVCASPKRHRHFIFEGGYACIRLRQAIHRAKAQERRAASRFRLIAAAVFRSTDAGANWTPLGTPARFNAFSVSGSGFNLIADGDPANNQVVYIAGLGDSQIFRNNGVNGTRTQIAGPGNASDDTTPHADSRDMSFIGNNTLVEADDGGIFYLTTPTPQHPLSPGGRGWRAAEHAEACEPGEGDRPLDNRFCANTPHPLPQGERAVSPATCQRSPTRACNVRNRMFPTLEPATPGDSSGPPA